MLTNQLAQSGFLGAFLAQESTSLSLMGVHLLAAIVFSVVGIIVFFASLLLMEKLTPFSIIKEIGEEHNTAVAIIIGAIVLGISVIVAAAIVG